MKKTNQNKSKKMNENKKKKKFWQLKKKKKKSKNLFLIPILNEETFYFSLFGNNFVFLFGYLFLQEYHHL